MLKLNGFRAATLAFACVLSVAAVWLLMAELARPGLPASPAMPERIPPAAMRQKMAEFAAEVGLVRGDLWAEYALTFGDLLWTSDGDHSDELEAARIVSLRALALAPHNSKVWALLAGLEARSGRADRATSMLKMSYYSGANETEIMPLRLRLALRLEVSADGELRQLISREIRAMARQPDLKPAILTAYQEASPSGKRFLESTLTDFDPILLASIRYGKRIDAAPHQRQ